MTYKDNPEIYDQETGEMLVGGERRMQKLLNLEGVRYKRGYEGVWASAEGLVFEAFSPEIHIIDKFDIPKEWPRYLSIDWGFRNPASCIWWARDPDNRLYAYKEIYKTKLTAPEFIQLIKANIKDGEIIHYASVDNADQDAIEQLRKARIRIKEPKKSRISQIDIVQQYLKVDETGKPAIFFLRDRLIHNPDEDLRSEYRPLDITDEFLTCTYDEKITSTAKDDEAIKGDHHGIDGTAYLLLSLKQQFPPELLKYTCFAVGVPAEQWDPEKHIRGVDIEALQKEHAEKQKQKENENESENGNENETEPKEKKPLLGLPGTNARFYR